MRQKTVFARQFVAIPKTKKNTLFDAFLGKELTSLVSCT